MANVRIACFGEPRIFINGERLRLAGEQPITLAVLAAAGPDGLTKEKLYADLFEENPQSTREQSAVMRVHRLAKRINQAAGSEIVITSGGRLAINETACDVDVWDFQAAIAAGETGWSDALASWDEPYQNLKDVPQSVLFAVEDLRRVYRGALTRAGWSLGPDGPAGVLEQILREVDEDPYNEMLIASAAAALYRLGRQPEALGLLSGYRKSLLESHGLVAGRTIDDVEQAILQHEIAQRPSESLSTTKAAQLPKYEPPQRFVGRTDTMERLESAIVSVNDGASYPRFHLIRGPGGSGKSTVVARLLAETRRLNLAIRTGRARSDGGLHDVSIYQPFLEAFPGLRAWLDAEQRDVALVDQVRLKFWAAVIETIDDHCARGPMLVVLEDLHATDSATIELVRHLASSDLPHNLMLLLSTREPEQESPWATTIRLFADQQNAEVHDLEPFGLEELQSIVRLDHPEQSLLSQERFARALLKASRGNAHAATTLSRDALKDAEMLALPESADLQNAYYSHVTKRVPDRETEQILWVAGLIGVEFEIDRVAQIVGVDLAHAQVCLERVAQLHLCHHVESRLWEFDHLLTAAAMAQAAGLMRPILYAKLARAGTDNPLRMLRYIKGGGRELDPDFAVAQLRWAAGHLEKIGALEECAEAWRALSNRLIAPSSDRLDAFIGAAGALSRIGHRAAAQAMRSQAVGEARRLGEPSGVYRAALAGLPSGEYAGGDSDRLATLLEMSDTEKKLVPPVEYTKWSLRLARACEQDETSLAIVDSIDWNWPGSFEQWADLRSEVLMFKAQGHRPEASLKEMSELANLCPDGPQRAELLHRVALAAIAEQISAAEIVDAIDQAVTQARMHGSPRTKWSVDVLAATVSAVGVRPTAETSATARASGYRWGIPDVEDGFQVQTFMELWISGQVGSAQGAIEAMRDQIAMNVAWQAGLALSAAVNGDTETAAAEIADAVAAMKVEPGGIWVEIAAALLAECAFCLDDPETAEVAAQSLGYWSGRAIVLGVGAAHFGPADRYLGLAAAVQGDRAADTLFARAIEQARRTGAEHWERQAQHNLASVRPAPI